VEASVAYRHCEQIVRTRARNFAYGIRLLRPPERQALSAVYAFARQIDDIGDGDDPAQVRLDQLAAARKRLDDIGEHPDDPVLVALADAARRHPIPLAAFTELIEGCEADVRGTDYTTFDDLVPYCRRVAGSIGRLSLGVFGCADRTAAEPLADALGIALQLTNILRDVREDALNGRVYLPADDLTRFGCELRLAGTTFADPPQKLAALVGFEAQRALEWYDTGLRLLPLLDRRSAACTAAMAGIYHRLLQRIAADPGTAMETRMSLPAWEKATVAVRALAGTLR
jgi:phytoene synthase